MNFANFFRITILWRNYGQLFLNRFSRKYSWRGNIEASGKYKDIKTLSDCNWPRTQNHLVLKWTLNYLAKLANWLNCVLSTYLYGAFDCMFLSCHMSCKFKALFFNKNWMKQVPILKYATSQNVPKQINTIQSEPKIDVKQVKTSQSNTKQPKTSQKETWNKRKPPKTN